MKQRHCKSVAMILAIPVLFVLAFAGPLALAQFSQRGSISGTVVDSSNAVVPGVHIKLLNEAQKATRETISDSRGHFQFENVVAGDYELTAAKAGFATAVSTPITVHLGTMSTYDFRLSVGQLQQTVTVSANATNINKGPIDVQTNVSSRQLESLPLNGQNFTQIAALAPGVSTSPQANVSGAQTWSVGAQYAVGGTLFQTGGTFQGSRDNGFYINGVNTDDNYMSSTMYLPSTEAIGSGTVQVMNYSASSGHDVSAILIQTKGGTSSFHGELFEFFQNNALNAMNPGVHFEDLLNGQTPTMPTLRRNRFGGNLGGPVYIPKILPGLKHKLFFFVNYEKLIEHDGNSLVEASMPSAAERKGNFCELLYLSDCADGDFSIPNPSPIQLYNPYIATYSANGQTALTRQPILNDRIDLEKKGDGSPLFDPSTTALMNALWPLPNVPNAAHPAPSNQINYTTFTNPQVSEFHIDTRFDVNLGQHDTFFVTWSNSGGSRDINGGIPPHFLYQSPTQDHGYLVTANYVHTFTTNLSNEFVFGYGDGWLLDATQAQLNWLNSSSNPINKYFNNTGIGPTEGTTAVFVGNYASPGPGAGLQRWENQTIQFSDNLIWIHGRNNVSAGMTYMRKGEKDWSIGQSVSFGGFTRSGSLAGYSGGDPMADLAIGLVSSMSPRFEMTGGSAFAPDGWLYLPYWAFYGNDKLRLTPKLSVSLGLRYELNIPMYTPNPTIEPCCQIYDASANGGAGVMKIPGIASGVPLHALKASKIEFAPRVSLSYALSPQRVIRAGYGIFYDAGASQAATQFTAQSPTGSGTTTGSLNREVSNTTLGVSPDRPNLTLASVFPAYVQQALGDYPVAESRGVGYFGDGVWWDGTPWGIIDQKSELMPYYQRISLDFQQGVGTHTVITLSYEGTQGRRGWDERNINLPPYRTGWPSGGGPGDPAFNAARPNNSGRWADLYIWMPENNSFYNAGIVQYNQNFSHGMQITSSYTLGKTISDYPSNVNSLAWSSQAGGGSGFQYPSEAGTGLYNRGEASLSHRNRFVFSGLWVPRYGLTWAAFPRYLLTGWQMAGIFTLESGDRETVTNGGPGVCDGPVCGSSAEDGAGFDELFVSGDPNLSHGKRSPNHQFDTSKFSVPPMGVRGNSGLGTIQGPGQDNLDFSLAKTFPVFENLKLALRADFFNALNHTQWMSDNTTFPSGDPKHPFGRVNTVNGSWNTQYNGGSREARVGQVEAKLVF